MSPTATAAAATNPSAATRLRVYTFNAATNVFANASGATSSGCDASESLSIGRIRSYSTPPRVSFSSPDAAAASTQRQPIPATAFTAQRLAEVLAARPQALLNTLLLDVSSPHNPNMPSPAIPYARRIPALLRLCHTLASVSDVSTSPLIASSSSSSSSPQGPPSPLACYPTGRKTLPISMSSPQPVGNDFARVETQDVQSMDTSDSDSCSSQTVNHDHFDYVKFFRDVVEGGMLQFHFSGLDLDFANSSECQADSHFNRRFLQPMPGSSPTQVIIIDDSGSATGFAAGLANYLASLAKSPNKPEDVKYLHGGLHALQKHSPWLFEASRIAPIENAGSIYSSELTPDTHVPDSGFLGWGDEACEQPGFVALVQVAAPEVEGAMDEDATEMEDMSMDDETMGNASMGSSGSSNDGFEDEDDEEGGLLDNTMDECMVDSGISLRYEDDAGPQPPLPSTTILATSPTTCQEPSSKSSTSSTLTSAPTLPPRPIAPAPRISKQMPLLAQPPAYIPRHPQQQFKHLPKTTSPTHDLRTLQHHLVASVWYGKRQPQGDAAVPIVHPLQVDAAGSVVRVTDFLHLSSCYAAADAAELKRRGIRHVLRLGWGFDGFKSGAAATCEAFDESDWSAWEGDEDDVLGPETAGVRESVQFFQSLAGEYGLASPLAHALTESQRRGTVDRARLRALLKRAGGGVSRRVGGAWRAHVYDFPIEDTPAAPIRWIFEKCTEVVEAARVLGERVLVHCHAGVSRSSTIVLAYLMRWRGLTLYESWLLTYKARPIIRPNEGFARALQELEREMHPHLANSTLPLFWMCDSYANFLEFLEVRERACRAGAQWPAPSNTLLDPPRGMMVTVPGLPLGRANSEDLGGDSDAWRAGMQVRAGLVRAGPVAVEEKAAAYAEKVHIVRGRSRGLSFGGRAG